MNFNDLSKQLCEHKPSSILFLVLGNDCRGDDGAGIVLAKQLSQTSLFQFSEYVYAYTTPENYLQYMIDQNPDIIICIDTARMGQIPGKISWIHHSELDSLGVSTHAFSITLIQKYINDSISVDFKYLGIEPQSNNWGNTLSSAVRQGIVNFFECENVL